MSGISHTHTGNIIVDADEHFIIDTTTRAIVNTENKKVTLMQFDHESERYSFDVDRIIDGHDLMDCNRVQVHFINIGSNKQKHPGLYLVDDVHVKESDDSKITFSWLISQDATQLSGVLSFLVSFECVDGATVLYRWSSSTYSAIQITAGMDNDNTIVELYADELLAWQFEMESKYIPEIVDLHYIERDFATSAEVAAIFDLTDSDVIPSVPTGPSGSYGEYYTKTETDELLDDYLPINGGTLKGMLYTEASTPYFIGKNKKVGMRAVDENNTVVGQFFVSDSSKEQYNGYYSGFVAQGNDGKNYALRISANGPVYRYDSTDHPIALKEDIDTAIANAITQTLGGSY